ncbi:hypothetical protein [uncultured Dokdonia sp.]|uniref:hypothetical protein n=1 Tax=uncultured Dokdonia sp. TaxID=575653 RepID=UPI00261A5F10|nr:hypothetical protein [uncultured Dokdonia sp.]
MGAVELRNKLIEIISNSDERFLRMVNALHKTYKEDISDEDEVVAYTIKGEALTKNDIVENNNEAIKSIERGEFKTHSEIRQKYARH